MEDLRLPLEVENRYEIVCQLGAGGMGSVYRAHDKQMDREVALKVILPELTEIKEVKKRFKREVQTLAKIKHPNVIQLYDYFGASPGASQVYTMEFVTGKSLRDLRENGPLPPRRARDIALQLADGLAATHEMGILHRDIKSANVVVKDMSTPVLIDFGLSRPDATAMFTKLTKSGALVGTLAYLPPEVFANQDYDKLCDVYQLGLVIYEMVTGTLPQEEASVDDIVFGRVQKRMLPPSEIVDLPGDYKYLDDVVKRAIGPREKRPSARELFTLLKGIDNRKPLPKEKTIGINIDNVESTNRLPILLSTLFLLFLGIYTQFTESKAPPRNPLAEVMALAETAGVDDGKKSWAIYHPILDKLSNQYDLPAYQWNDAIGELRTIFGKDSPASLSVAAVALQRDGKKRLAADKWLLALQRQNEIWDKERKPNLDLLTRMASFTKEAILCSTLRNEERYEMLDGLRKRQFRLSGAQLTSLEFRCCQLTIFLGWVYVAARTEQRKIFEDMQNALAMVHVPSHCPKYLLALLNDLKNGIITEAKKNEMNVVTIDFSRSIDCDSWFAEATRLTSKADRVGSKVEYMFKGLKDMLNWREKRKQLLNDEYLRTTRTAAWTNWMGYCHFPKEVRFAREAVRTWCDVHNFQMLEDVLPGKKEFFRERWGKELAYEPVIELSCQVIHTILEQIPLTDDLGLRIQYESIMFFLVKRTIWTSPHDYTMFAKYLDPLVAKPERKGTIIEAFYRGRRAFSAHEYDLAANHFADAWERLIALDKSIEKQTNSSMEKSAQRKNLCRMFPFMSLWFYAIKASKSPQNRIQVTKRVLDYLAQFPEKTDADYLCFKYDTLLHLVDSAKRYGDMYVIDNAKRLLEPVTRSIHPLQKNFANDLLNGRPLPQIDNNTRIHEPMTL